MSEDEQLKQLIDHVRKQYPSTMIETQKVIQSYFNGIGWSLLKDEWEKMSDTDKRAFVQKVHISMKFVR